MADTALVLRLNADISYLDTESPSKVFVLQCVLRALQDYLHCQVIVRVILKHVRYLHQY